MDLNKTYNNGKTINDSLRLFTFRLRKENYTANAINITFQSGDHNLQRKATIDIFLLSNLCNLSLISKSSTFSDS